MNDVRLFVLGNGLAVAADAFAMMLVLLVAMAIGLTGMLAVCFRSLRTMYVQLGLLIAFVLQFQPWRVWTDTPPSPATDSEWESAQDVIDLISFCTVGLLLFTLASVALTVYQVRQHAQLEEELRQMKSARQDESY